MTGVHALFYIYGSKYENVWVFHMTVLGLPLGGILISSLALKFNDEIWTPQRYEGEMDPRDGKRTPGPYFVMLHKKHCKLFIFRLTLTNLYPNQT